MANLITSTVVDNFMQAADVAGARAALGISEDKLTLYRAPSAELITNIVNRDLSGPTNWTGANWTQVGNTFVHTPGSTAALTLSSAFLTPGSIKVDCWYRIVCTVAGHTAGTVTPKLSPSSLSTAITTLMGGGTFLKTVYSNANDANLVFTPDSAFNGSITNISVIEEGINFRVTKNGDVQTGPPPNSTGPLAFVREGNVQVFEMLTYYDSNTANVIRSVKYRGTIASPKAILDSDTLFNFQMGGYDGAARFSNQSGFGAFASGNWTPTNHGTLIRFTATPLNSITSGTVVEFHGDKLYFAKPVGIGVATPTAKLHLPAGTSDAGKAPLKLESGTLLSTPEAGAVEYDGTNLYYTNSLFRRAIATLPISTPVMFLADAVTAGVGARAFASDALLPVFGSAVVGGGGVGVPVYSDGTIWRVG